jgi:hypothetical protein
MLGNRTPLLSLICLLLISCGTAAPEKTITEPAKVTSDSSSIIRVKPLSTEKTHEGGVDQTKLIFK